VRALSRSTDSRSHACCPWCGQSVPDAEQAPLASLNEPTPASAKVRRSDPGTSRDAAKLAFPNQGSQRARILIAVGHRSGGLTAEQIAQRTGIKYVSASTRCTELVRGGWLVVNGERDGKQVLWLTEAAGEFIAARGWATSTVTDELPEWAALSAA
jgi:hypothetical protein